MTSPDVPDRRDGAARVPGEDPLAGAPGRGDGAARVPGEVPVTSAPGREDGAARVPGENPVAGAPGRPDGTAPPLGEDPTAGASARRDGTARPPGEDRRADAPDRSASAGRPPTNKTKRENKKKNENKKDRKRLPGQDPVWARLLVAGGLVLAVLAAGALVAKEALFSYATRSVAQQNLLGDSGRQAQQRGHVDITGAKNILLIGIDARPGQDPADLVRADSIIILHIPATHDQAYLVSIPRDTWVKIPPYDNGAKRYGGGHDKINGAYAWGGDGLTGANQRAHAVELLALTIRTLWGITFDGAAIVDFTGFQQVVEVLGGVDMYVDQETTSVHIGHDANGEYKVPFRQYTRSDGGQGLSAVPGVTPVVYHVGFQHLEPWQALDFVRQRELLPNSDYDRQRHQQQFLKALFKKMLSRDVLTDPGKLNQVLQVVGKAMTIDSGGIDLADWVYAMKGIGGDDLLTIKTNNGTFNGDPDVANAELLDQTTLELLEAIKTEQVPSFVAGHLDLVAPS